MTPPAPHCPDERLNTVIAVGLLIALVVCISIYGVRAQQDGQIIQLAGTIAGGLVGFLARSGRGQGANVQAGPSGNVTIEAQPAADEPGEASNP